MRVIKKRIPARKARTVTSYQCGTCKTKYHSESKARECEKKKLEHKLRIGDLVGNNEPRQCGSGGPYYFKGRIIEIIGPQLPDYEYEVKWLGGSEERLNSHVYCYIVNYKCPICRELKTAIYYRPELKLIARKKK